MSASNRTAAMPTIMGSRLAKTSVNIVSHDLSELALPAEILRLVPERRTQAGELVATDDAARGVLALDLVNEEVLQRHDLAFHADDLRDMGDLTRTIAQAGCLDDHVDRS